MAFSAQRHPKMADQYESKQFCETTIDWECIYADRCGLASLLLSSGGKRVNIKSLTMGNNKTKT